MGRGANGTAVSASGASARSRRGARGAIFSVHKHTIDELLDQDRGIAGEQIKVGEVDLGNGVTEDLYLTVSEDTPALGVQGVAEIDGVYPKGNDRYTIAFKDGSRALVDLKTMSVAFSNGDEHDQARVLGAIYAALGEKHALADSEPLTAALADARAALQENPDSPQAYEEYARAARAVLAEQDGEITVNPEHLQPWAAEQQRQQEGPQLSYRARMRRRYKEMMATVQRAAEAGSKNPFAAVLFGVNENGEANEIPEDVRKMFQDAANRLGGEDIVDENGNVVGNTLIPTPLTDDQYALGQQEYEMAVSFCYADSIGTRLFGIRGPHGTGKGLFVRQIAATYQAPLVEFTLGEGVQIQQMLGDTGIKAKEIYDEDGNLKGVSPETNEQVGKLLRALKEPCFILINEPEDIKQMFLALNTAVGDRIGDTSGRTVNTNTAEGKDIQHIVHPECRIFVTWNPGHENKGFAESTYDRGWFWEMRRGSVDEEKVKYAKMITAAMKYQQDVPHLQREFTPDECTVIAKVAERLQNAYTQDYGTFVNEPGPRTMARFAAALLLDGEKGPTEHPQELAMKQLRHLLPAYPAMTDAEAYDHLRQQLRDFWRELSEFAAIGLKARQSS
jgi:hypothetical protein